MMSILARHAFSLGTVSFVFSRGIMQDSLVLLPPVDWIYLQDAFKSDWPRGISGYTVLETQSRWLKEGFEYGFKVFCPFGDVRNGMVALNRKDTFYEVIIQCPTDDTTYLEKALKSTKEIDWNRNITIPFAPFHVIECIKRVTEDTGVNVELILPSDSFILNKNANQFKDVSLPDSITFGLLTTEDIDLVNAKWPHRYPGSSWYFKLLIKTQSGFGLFENNSLISWVFINEAGTLGHMYTVERYRRKGFAELLLKLVSNELLKDNKDVFAFAVRGNLGACSLYKKVGFEKFGGVAWCYLNGKKL